MRSGRSVRRRRRLRAVGRPRVLVTDLVAGFRRARLRRKLSFHLLTHTAHLLRLHLRMHLPQRLHLQLHLPLYLYMRLPLRLHPRLQLRLYLHLGLPQRLHLQLHCTCACA